MTHDISFGELVETAFKQVVPDPADVVLDAWHFDTVMYLANAWYIGRYHTLWSPLHFTYTDRYSEDVYLKAPTSLQQHRAVVEAEMAKAMRRTLSQYTPITWDEWQHLAEQDPTGAYPCLVPYGPSNHARVGVFFRALLTRFPTRDPRAIDIVDAAQAAFAPVFEQIDLFDRVARYRAAIRAHKAWPAFCNALAPSEQDFAAEWQKLVRFLLWPCVSCNEAPEATATQERELLVALLVSRVLREDVLTRQLFSLREHIEHNLPMQPTQLQLDVYDAKVDDFMAYMRSKEFFLRGDDNDSIATLARHCTQQVAGLDILEIERQVRIRVNVCQVRLLEQVVHPTHNAILKFWAEKVPHDALRVDAARALGITAKIHADFALLDRKSYAQALPTAAQMQFRATATWWHPTVTRARMCACGRSQSAYVSCMLIALFRKGLAG